MDNSGGRERGSKHLKKQNVGVLSAAILIFSFVCAGAFGLEESVAAAGPGITLIMLAALVVLWALPYCLTVSELSALFPDEGGEILWAKNTLGEFWSFQYFFWYFIGNILYTASLAVLCVNYLGFFFEMAPWMSTLVKLAIIALVLVLNLRGFKEVTVLNTVLSIFILAVFALITVVGFMHWNFNPFNPICNPELGNSASIGTALSVCIWMYAGWAGINQLGGEVKDKRTVPRAFLVACPLIGLAYFLPLMASVACIGNWDLWSTNLAGGNVGFATVLELYIGPIGGGLVVLTALIGNLASLNVTTASTSRSLLVQADYRLMPPSLNLLSRRRNMPYLAILVVCVLTAVFMQFDITLLIICCAMSTLIEVSIAIACLIGARRLYPVAKRDADMITIPGGRPVFWAVCGSIGVLVLLTLFLSGTDYYLLALFTAIVPPVLYVLFKRRFGGLAQDHPLRYPDNPRTKLAAGDLRRISGYFLVLGGLGVAGAPLLWTIEGGAEAAGYYLETYGSGLLSNFTGMLWVAGAVGLVLLCVGVVCRVLMRRLDAERVPGVVLPEEMPDVELEAEFEDELDAELELEFEAEVVAEGAATGGGADAAGVSE